MRGRRSSSPSLPRHSLPRSSLRCRPRARGPMPKASSRSWPPRYPRTLSSISGQPGRMPRPRSWPSRVWSSAISTKATPMRSPVELKGRIASGGIFSGPIVHVGGALKARREAGSPEAERAALETAIVAARSAIAALMEKVESEASDMLAFQLAMLEDEALSAPALSAIGEGAAADEAWSRALGVEIAGYTSSQDSYFQARAADLEDIRDRVLRNLFATSENGIKEPSILAGEDVPPTLFLETDWSSGGAIALAGGSPSSHVAMLARARGVPMVV